MRANYFAVGAHAVGALDYLTVWTVMHAPNAHVAAIQARKQFENVAWVVGPFDTDQQARRYLKQGGHHG